MKNLIIAGFRLIFRHSRLAWLTLAAALTGGAAAGFFGCVTREDGHCVFRPDLLFYTVPLLLILLTVALILNIGEEQGGGTVRNKLISGYTKLQVCAAWLTVTLVFSLLAALLYLAPLRFFCRNGLSSIPDDAILRMFFVLGLLFLLLGAIACLLSLLFQKQTYAAAAVLGFAAVLTVAAVSVRSNLSVPEFIEDAVVLRVPAENEPGEHLEINAYGDVASIDDNMRSFVNKDYELYNDGKIYRSAQVSYVNPNPFFVRPPKRYWLKCLNALNPANALIASAQSAMAGIVQNDLDCSVADTASNIARLEQLLTEAENRNDADSEWEASVYQSSITQEQRNLRRIMAEAETEIASFTDETRSLPQCMLAVLIAFCTAGILIFKRRNII